MITQFKIFEGRPNTRNKFWLVKTTQPYLEISCKKIDAPFEDFEFIIGLKVAHQEYRDLEYINIVTDYENKWGYNGWAWSSDTSMFKNDKRYIYMGEVEVTDKDIEQWKLEREANKYNL
jgi:hypothetical protein